MYIYFTSTTGVNKSNRKVRCLQISNFRYVVPNVFRPSSPDTPGFFTQIPGTEKNLHVYNVEIEFIVFSIAVVLSRIPVRFTTLR